MSECNEKQQQCDDGNDCPMLFRIRMLEKKTESQEKQIGDVTLKQALLERDLTNILNKVNEIGMDVKQMMNVPTTRYNTIIVALITAVIGLVVGYVFKGGF